MKLPCKVFNTLRTHPEEQLWFYHEVAGTRMSQSLNKTSYIAVILRTQNEEIFVQLWGDVFGKYWNITVDDRIVHPCVVSLLDFFLAQCYIPYTEDPDFWQVASFLLSDQLLAISFHITCSYSSEYRQKAVWPMLTAVSQKVSSRTVFLNKQLKDL